MRNLKRLVLLLVFLISLTIIFTSIIQPHTLLLGDEYDVRVINGFRDNSSSLLIIWCTSPQGDLGGQALQEGEDFGWTAKIELLWWNAVYTCTVKREERRKRFEAFKVPRDSNSNRCASTRKCCWSVREDGFYFSSDEVYWNKDFSWS